MAPTPRSTSPVKGKARVYLCRPCGSRHVPPTGLRCPHAPTATVTHRSARLLALKRPIGLSPAKAKASASRPRGRPRKLLPCHPDLVQAAVHLPRSIAHLFIAIHHCQPMIRRLNHSRISCPPPSLIMEFGMLFDLSPDNISCDQLAAYAEWLIQGGLSAQTVRNHFDAIKALYSWVDNVRVVDMLTSHNWRLTIKGTIKHSATTMHDFKRHHARRSDSDG